MSVFRNLCHLSVKFPQHVSVEEKARKSERLQVSPLPDATMVTINVGDTILENHKFSRLLDRYW